MRARVPFQPVKSGCERYFWAQLAISAIRATVAALAADATEAILAILATETTEATEAILATETTEATEAILADVLRKLIFLRDC